ncbi:3'-5' exonuclease [Clostridium tarantellae]|uniref:3'-5' exonuclease n=1 Tax=Clostridium tarantellae TaxID=39493 RepID=A0A6I1MQA7_9CLOT|nr:3'-5' exonuclease [Clostridium tarantellae]MPQ44327.1 3'-5' exonuclease [Clostridium tarantellae]
MKLLFFDTETTGIKPGSICQLSYIIVDTTAKPQKTVGKNFFFTVDEMEPEAEKVHGFSLEKLYELSNGLCFEDCFEEFFNDFIKADFIMGHNVQFDIKFLKHELNLLGEEFIPNNIFCTMQYYRPVCKILRPSGDYKNPKLEEVIKFLNISNTQISTIADKLFNGSGNYHDARFDTTATYLTVIEGIKKGLIPKNYFSNLLKNKA